MISSEEMYLYVDDKKFLGILFQDNSQPLSC